MCNKKITILLLLFLIACKKDIYANNDLIKLLKDIDKSYSIVLWENEIDIDNGNPVGEIFKSDNNELVCDTGMGFSVIELLELKQIDKNKLYIKVKSKSCIEFDNGNDDFPPECKKWKNLIIEYELTKKQIMELNDTDTTEINLVGKVLEKEISNN